MITLINDIKYAFRTLIKRPGFTFIAVLTLTIGIGANVAVYSFVHTILLNPLPVKNADRLVQIRAINKKTGQYPIGVNPPTIMELHQHDEVFSKLIVYENDSLTFHSEPFQERVHGIKVSPDFFDMWDIPPLLGRTFAAHEGEAGQGQVIMLSYGYWKSRFGARKDIIGETIHFNEMTLTVVGVMPAEFQFPYAGKSYWIPNAEPVMPQAYDYRSFGLIGRLQTGVTLDQVQILLDTVATRHTQNHPEENREFGITVRPLRMMFTTDAIQKTLLSLIAVVGFILMIACVNLANLLFGHTEARKQELAIRNALGAGRFRLLRQLLTESVCLAVIGGLCGLCVTHWTIKALSLLIPANMPQLQAIQIDFTSLGMALVISIVVGIGIGLTPAWFACRGKISNALQQASVKTGPDRKRKRISRILVGSEVALAVVLLSGAGLMISSVIKLLRVDPGYNPTNLVRVYLTLPWEKYHDLNKKNFFLRQLHETWSALPGVESVGICVYHFGQKPESWIGPNGTILQIHKVGCGVGKEDYLREIGAPLRAGRYLEERDIGDQCRTILVNEHLARLFGLGTNPVGKTVTKQTPQGQTQYEVIGVVGDSQEYALNQAIEPIYYRPYQDIPLGPAQIITVRANVKPQTLYPYLRQELKTLEPMIAEAPAFEIVSSTLYDSTASHRLYMKCLTLAAIIGLALAVLGIYGVMTHSIAVRTKEIGIHLALGALPKDVMRNILWQGMKPVFVGIPVGLLGTLWLARYIESKLFHINSYNPIILSGVICIFLSIAALAAWIPAKRAAKLDPMEALRYE